MRVISGKVIYKSLSFIKEGFAKHTIMDSPEITDQEKGNTFCQLLGELNSICSASINSKILRIIVFSKGF